MGITNYIKNIFRRSSPSTGAQPRMPRTGGWYAPIVGGDAMSVATVYRCVNLLADSVANLPMQFLRLKNGIFEADINSRLHYLLTVQPDTHLSAFEFWRQLVRYMQLEGNAYIVPVYNSVLMEIDRLVLVSPSAVAHDTTNNTYTINDLATGIKDTYDEDEIVHIKNYSLDGKVGLSTLTYARMAVDIAIAGDKETLNRFANGGNVRGIVSNDTSVRGFGEYQDNELDKTAEDLDQKFSSGRHIVSMPGDAKFNSISLSSTDMQFLESRKFSVPEICRFFGVHPSFVFADTSTNYKSVEMANVAFLSNTLNPILRNIENELLRKLVAPSLATKRKFEFDRRGLYSCDLESRIKYQAQTIAAGIYTVNEWRAIENKPAVEGGDRVLVSANLKGINDVVAAQNDEPNNNNQEDE